MLKHADLFCYRGLVWQDVRTVCLCWLIDSESRKLIVATLATHTHGLQIHQIPQSPCE